jgi:O-antigen ligase
VLRLAFAAVVVCGVLALTEFRAPFSGGELSWRYVATSVSSILGTQERQGTGPDLEATKRWRLAWWGQIVSYTVQGEHFWLGKGYGINLAVDDGRRGPDATLRSPHNAFMTILARSGVPGLVLWVAFLAALSWRLTTLMLSPGAAPSDRQFAVWALAYLAAFLANASFDVYLEGPMGGIWFWTIVGICIVRTRERGERPGARW